MASSSKSRGKQPAYASDQSRPRTPHVTFAKDAEIYGLSPRDSASAKGKARADPNFSSSEDERPGSPRISSATSTTHNSAAEQVPVAHGVQIPTIGQHVFTHQTGGYRYNQFHGFGNHQAAFGAPQHYQPGVGYVQGAQAQPSFPVSNFPGAPACCPTPGPTSAGQNSPSNMATYPNNKPPNLGLHFQPQVPDTTNGPYTHTYIPRHDAGGSFVQPGMVSHFSCSGLPVATGGTAIPIGHPGFPIGAVSGPGPFAPVIVQQPGMPVSMMVPNGPVSMHGPFSGQPILVPGPPPVVTGNVPMSPFGMPLAMGPTMMSPGPLGMHLMPEPASGIGPTASEMNAHYAEVAADPDNPINQPQDIRPADPDVSRMYWTREVDGNWTMRNRFTIDDLEDCRWYVSKEGVFFAVRQPN